VGFTALAIREIWISCWTQRSFAIDR
jgi:hypothetical protein